MEKNLSKYITISEAEANNYVTAKTIRQLCERNLIPFINDLGEILVNPADITEFIETKVFGASMKPPKRKKMQLPDPPVRDSMGDEAERQKKAIIKELFPPDGSPAE